MILHLTPGSTPVEVHVHGEFGETERLTVAPRFDVPASAPPAAPIPPAPTPGRRWPVAIAPVVALLAGFIGYQVGATSPRDDVRRLASVKEDLRLPQPSYIPAAREPAVQVARRVPQLESAPAGPTEVPSEIAQLLAQRPAVSPPVAAAPLPEPRPRPAPPAGGNPFGLE